MQMKLIIFVSLLLMFVIYFFLNLSGSLFSFDCVDTVKSEKISPDHKIIATVFERDCGATTEISTMLSLRKFSQPFESINNELVFIIAGANDVSVNWSDLHNLLVTYIEGNIFRQEKIASGVSITYKSAK